MNRIKEIFNFDQIGQKLKTWAKWSCWITILLAWIAAIIYFIILLFTKGTFLIAFLVPIIAALYSLLIWVGSWATYAFGEYIEDTKAIRINTEIIVQSTNHNPAEKSTYNTECKTTEQPKNKAEEMITTNISIENITDDTTWMCGKCNTRNLLSNNTCWRCNNPK